MLDLLDNEVAEGVGFKSQFGLMQTAVMGVAQDIAEDAPHPDVPAIPSSSPSSKLLRCSIPSSHLPFVRSGPAVERDVA
jgi:hypothetical protein